MTTQTPAIVIPRPRRHPGRRLFLGLAAAALAVLVGAGLWQAGRDDSTATVSQPAAPVERSVTTSQVGRTPTYYIVASQAQADSMRAAIDEATAIRAALGQPPLSAQVVWLASAEAEARFQLGINDDTLMRSEAGSPAISVIDLRGRSVAAGAESGAADSLGGLAELIRDGGTPASLGLPTATGTAEAERPTATSEGQLADVPHFTP